MTIGRFLRSLLPSVRVLLFGSTSLTTFGVMTSTEAVAGDPQLNFTLGSMRGGLGVTSDLVLLSADGTTLAFEGHSTTGRVSSISNSSGETSLGSLGGSVTIVQGISANGAVAVGTGSTITGEDRAFSWSGGVMTDLGTLGGTASSANAVSADGSVVVGESRTVTNDGHAFRWSGGVMSDLGTLGGNQSWAGAVSANGSVVVGWGDTAINDLHAFRWTGGVMTDLGTLGGVQSWANAVSADGSVVAGQSYTSSAEFHTFRWTNGIMTDIGTLGGKITVIDALSSDGSTIVGTSELISGLSEGNEAHAYRWSNGSMVDLGTLGGILSTAHAVSADGSVVVGWSDTATGPSAAFRWTSSTGMKSVRDLLIASGVDMTGWTLKTAQAVSADGTVIAGKGLYAGDPRDTAWIARCLSACAIITPGIIAESVGSISGLGRTGDAALVTSIGSFYESATKAFDRDDRRTRRFSVFAHGLYDSDPTLTGSIGATWALTDDFLVGAEIGAAQIRTDLAYRGSSTLTGVIGGAFAAYAPNDGFQFFTGISSAATSGSVNRGYLNGNTIVSSTGDTTAQGVGANVRIGWAFDQLMPQTRLTPFAGITLAGTHFAGWIEKGGPFPATISPFTAYESISHVGLEGRYTLEQGRWLWGSLAWGHRLDDGHGATIAADVTGITNVSMAGSRAAVDWAEARGGVRQKVGDAGVFTASLAAILPERGQVTWLPRVGLGMSF